MKLIRADWPAPRHIHALTTTRLGGCSQATYSGLNLGDHVGDNPASVAQNRDVLVRSLGLQLAPQWLAQVHGTEIVEARPDAQVPVADGCYSSVVGQACIVMTADCLPLLITNRSGTRVAAVHAGWRGLVNGVVEAALAKFSATDELLVWMGPAIGPLAFEVGAEVREAFVADLPETDSAFRISPTHAYRYLADLYELARLRLKRAGVTEVSGGQHCTLSEPELFYSYRRDQQTGRMASVIWIGD